MEAVQELDEALAGWLLQGPARREWGWEWGWDASDHQDQDWDSEEIPAVSEPPQGPRELRLRGEAATVHGRGGADG